MLAPGGFRGHAFHICSESCALVVKRVGLPKFDDATAAPRTPIPDDTAAVAAMVDRLPRATRAYVMRRSEDRGQELALVVSEILEDVGAIDAFHRFSAVHRSTTGGPRPATPEDLSVLNGLRLLDSTRALVRQIAEDRGEALDVLIGEAVDWYREQFEIR